MITKNRAFFVFLTILFAHAHGMDQEVGSAGRSCRAAEAGQSSASSSRVEHARPARRDGANSEKMALAFILGTAAPRADIGYSSVATTGATDGVVEKVSEPSSCYGHWVNPAARFRCVVCGKPFSCKGEYTNHIRATHKDYLYRCLICNQLLLHHQFFSHMCEGHGSVTTSGFYKCSCCSNAEYSRRNSLGAHALKEHVELTNLPAALEMRKTVRELVEASFLRDAAKSSMQPPA